jgi:hypothetical protein
MSLIDTNTYGDVEEDIASKDPSGWGAEEDWGRGVLCYAASTVALNRAMGARQLTQLEVAHLNAMGLNRANFFEVQGGEKAKQYAEMLGVVPGGEIPTFDQGMADMAKPLLGQVWGDPDYDGLNIERHSGLDEEEIERVLRAGGVVAANNPVHCRIIWGCTRYVTGLRTYKVWDPANGSSKMVEFNDFGELSINEFVYVR